MKQIQSVPKEIEESFLRTVAICQLKREIGKNIFELGKYLYQVKSDYDLHSSDETEILYGHGTWRAYLAAPEQSGGVDMLPQTANRAIRLYQKYVIELDLKVGFLSEMDYTKWDMIRNVVNQNNLDVWIHKAKVLARSDLAKELAELEPEKEKKPEPDYRKLWVRLKERLTEWAKDPVSRNTYRKVLEAMEFMEKMEND